MNSCFLTVMRDCRYLSRTKKNCQLLRVSSTIYYTKIHTLINKLEKQTIFQLNDYLGTSFTWQHFVKSKVKM